MLAVRRKPILRLETIGVIRCVSFKPAIYDACMFPTQRWTDGDMLCGNSSNTVVYKSRMPVRPDNWILFNVYVSHPVVYI